MLDYVYLQTFYLAKICLGENVKIRQIDKVYSLNSERP